MGNDASAEQKAYFADWEDPFRTIKGADGKPLTTQMSDALGLVDKSFLEECWKSLYSNEMSVDPDVRCD